MSDDAKPSEIHSERTAILSMALGHVTTLFVTVAMVSCLDRVVDLQNLAGPATCIGLCSILAEVAAMACTMRRRRA